MPTRTSPQGRATAGLAVAVTMLACGGVAPPLAAQVSPAPPDDAEMLAVEAAAYLAEAIGIIRENAFRTDSVDWTIVGAAAFDSAAGAVVPVDTYRAIRYVLRSLGDHHSFLQLSRELNEREQERLHERGLLEEGGRTQPGGRPISPFQDRRRPEGSLRETEGRRLAHVVVPRSGALPTEEFAAAIHGHVTRLAATDPCGWIVDLRGNGGGNMWPMLAGIGPLIGTERPGSFVGRDGPFGIWYYRDGEAGMEGVGGTEGFVGAAVPDAVEVSGLPPVVVLIDGGTGSSGEAVAIAFNGRPNTRFVGVPSAGFSTSNDGFRLPDGANLVVTVGLDVDRTGRPYPLDVKPDEQVPYTDGEPDTQLARAEEWLLRQEACEEP